MNLLQIGVPKSGNFWLFQILQNILRFSDRPTESFISQHPIQDLATTWDLNYPSQSTIDMIDITDLQVSYRISSIFRMPLTDWNEYLSRSSQVWTHSPVCKRSPDVFNRFDKKIYIIRDPRDVVLSASRYYCSPYMQKYFPHYETVPEEFLEKHLPALLQDWVWHVWDHLRLRKDHNIHICFFEGFLLDFQQELDHLMEYLELPLSFELREKLQELVSFSTLKKTNPKHLKKGTSGQWRSNLSQDQLELCSATAGPLLDRLGYYTQEQVFPRSEEIDLWDFEELKQEIISSQEIPFS